MVFDNVSRFQIPAGLLKAFFFMTVCEKDQHHETPPGTLHCLDVISLFRS